MTSSWNATASGQAVAAIIAVATSVPAQAADTDQAGEREIIVTGEKTDRTLRETASSVVVETQQDIRRRAALFTLNDLLARIPNIVSIEPGNDAPAVRGIDGTGPASGANAFLAGTRPRLNYQVDGRTLGFNEALFSTSSLWDVAQAEVYRGPQSTLQGRNAIAGVIALRTVDPAFDWSGAARATIGSRDELQLSGALGGPIVEDLAAFRISADWQRSRSFVTYTPYPEEDDPGLSEVASFRGKLLLTPAAGLRSLWTLSYQDGRQPQAAHVLWPFDTHVAPLPKMPVFRSRTTTLISDSSYELSDGVVLQAYLSASDFRVDRYSPVGTGNVRIDGMEYIAQPFLRLGQRSDAVSGFIAAYVFRTHQEENADLFGGGHWRDETDTTAVFGEATLRPAERVSLILGARYEVEKRFRAGSAGAFVTDFDAVYREFLPKATLSFDVDDAVTIGASAGRGYNAGGAGLTLFAPIVNYQYKPEFVWNFEGFLRAGIAPGLTLNGNVFFNDYKDIQLPFYLGVNSVIISNAQRATTYGAEMQLDWRPSAGNRAFASFGVLETKLNRYDGQAMQGNDLPRAPAFSAAAGFVVTPIDRIELGADVRFSDSYYSDVLNSARGKIDPWAMVNAQIA